MIPPNHAVLQAPSLEAEAFGLLDRMLVVLQEAAGKCSYGLYTPLCTRWIANALTYSEALLVDATLNTLSVLIRARPSTSSRILNAVLSFNPFKLAHSPMTPRTKVLIKSMEKTTRMLLMHLSKR